MCLDQTRHGIKDKGQVYVRGLQNVFGTAEWPELTKELFRVNDETTATGVSLLEPISWSAN
jgi:hypothetical protein